MTEQTKDPQVALVAPEDEAAETLKLAAHMATTGDISKMTLVQKATFLHKLAVAEGIPPFPNPYAIIKGQDGREKIIGTKNRAEALRKRDGISTRIVYKGALRMGEGQVDPAFYEVEVEGTTKDGRTAMDLGINSIKGLVGQELANKVMGAVTKAQNRVTNSLSGSGMMDEGEARDSGFNVTEVTLPGPRHIAPPPVPVYTVEARAEGLPPTAPPVVGKS